ncbi:hypothetical protein CPC08DRAFT_605522, partial [Agrocybe pediades]
STSSSPFLLPSAEQYDGSNWIEFKAKIRAAAKQRGVLGYLDGTIKQPDPEHADYKPRVATSYWGSSLPTPEEWEQRDAWAQGLITLNVKNAIGLGVALDGSAAETYRSIAS